MAVADTSIRHQTPSVALRQYQIVDPGLDRDPVVVVVVSLVVVVVVVAVSLVVMVVGVSS